MSETIEQLIRRNICGGFYDIYENRACECRLQEEQGRFKGTLTLFTLEWILEGKYEGEDVPPFKTVDWLKSRLKAKLHEEIAALPVGERLHVYETIEENPNLVEVVCSVHGTFYNVRIERASYLIEINE